MQHPGVNAARAESCRCNVCLCDQGVLCARAILYCSANGSSARQSIAKAASSVGVSRFVSARATTCGCTYDVTALAVAATLFKEYTTQLIILLLRMPLVTKSLSYYNFISQTETCLKIH